MGVGQPGESGSDACPSTNTGHCQLPGGKQKRGETVNTAIKRIIEDRLALPDDSIEIQSTSMETTKDKSKKFAGVQTTYLKTVCRAFPNGIFDETLEECKAVQMQVRNDAVVEDMQHSFVNLRHLYLLGKEDAKRYYTWLSPPDFAYFTSQDGQSMLNHFLSCSKYEIPLPNR